MKLSIRRNVFETNSSSIHACVILPEEDYNLWKDNDNYVQTSHEDGHTKFVVVTKEEVESKFLDEYLEGMSDVKRDNYDRIDYEDWLQWDKGLIRYNQFGYDKYGGNYYESDRTTFVTPSGDVMVAEKLLRIRRVIS